jgi:hypothetical protein
MTRRRWVLRTLWVAVRLLAALWLMQPGRYFFYQGF